MPAALLINSLDAQATYGFVMSDAPSWLDMPPRTTPSQAVLNKQGAIVTAATVEAPKRLTLNGFVTSATAAQTRTNIDALKAALLAPAGVQLTFSDNSTRFITCTLDNFTVQWSGPALIERRLRVTIQMTAYDPYFYDISLSSVAFNIATSIGTGIIRPVLTLTGALASPIIISLKDEASVVVSAMTLTLTTVGGDTVVIDNDARTIKRNGASIIGTMTGGDFFAIEATDPRFNTAPFWFFIMTANGVSGNAQGSVSWRRAWR